MDYIEELKKLKKELLEASDKNVKTPGYKMMAYRETLEKFVKHEHQDFCNKLLGAKGKDKPLDIDSGLKLLALGLIDENTTYGDLEDEEVL